MLGIARGKQHDAGAGWLHGLAIILEDQIVDPAALEGDRALEARRIDRDARAFLQRLLAAQDLAPRILWRGLLPCLLSRLLGRLCRRLRGLLRLLLRLLGC